MDGAGPVVPDSSPGCRIVVAGPGIMVAGNGRAVRLSDVSVVGAVVSARAMALISVCMLRAAIILMLSLSDAALCVLLATPA